MQAQIPRLEERLEKMEKTQTETQQRLSLGRIEEMLQKLLADPQKSRLG